MTQRFMHHTASATLAATTSDGDMADLYRAVSPEEFEDVLRTRSFRPRPGGESLDAKQFARNLHETIALANYLPDTVAVIRARVPASVVDHLDLTPVDRTILRSGSVTVQPDTLDLFNSSIVELEHVF